MQSTKSVLASWIIFALAKVEALTGLLRNKALELRQEGLDEEARAVPDPDEARDAYFSQTAWDRKSRFIWMGEARPTFPLYERANGDVVAVTCVCRPGEDCGARHRDLKYVGRVVRFHGFAEELN